ncbi:MAG: N-acetylmuramoyl-L-alanine amidase [Chloroflexi bacterium]|nr:N-acetylmuramoyl-L-alanine amidase [Chloroflexota bacterium]
MKQSYRRCLAALAAACFVCITNVAVLPASPASAQTSARTYTVFLDPGHGSGDGGATSYLADGTQVREASVSLSIALKTTELLRAGGLRVVLSREQEYRSGHGDDSNADGRTNYRDDLLDVVDMANDSKADLFISMHHNGSVNADASGVEVYYCSDRAFAAQSAKLADLVQANLMQGLRDIGYEAQARGVKDDAWLYSYRSVRGHLYVLGPEQRRGHPRATAMPGVLGEALFVSNPAEAQLLASEGGQWAIARGYANAVVTYFAGL